MYKRESKCNNKTNEVSNKSKVTKQAKHESKYRDRSR